MKKLLSLILAIVLVLSMTAIVAVGAADDTATVSLYDINGKLVKTNTYKVGETFEVTVYLDTSKLCTIGALKAEQLYTSSVLALADELTSSGSIKNLTEVFPVTGTTTIANGKLDGKISFNASTPDFDPDGYQFTSADAVLIRTHYTVIASGNAAVENNIVTLALADYDVTKIVNKSAVVSGYENSFSTKYEISDPQYVPTEKPTSAPTSAPTVRPTAAPTSAPTVRPTAAPTSAPTVRPTAAPTSAPTVRPTAAPTSAPTVRPTAAPTSAPTVRPTAAPTSAPTVRPTAAPTSAPTVRPTAAPTSAPTAAPTAAPQRKTGDSDGDGVLTPMDVTNVQRYLATLSFEGTETTMKDADIDRNGRIEIVDAGFIQRHLAGIKIPYEIG